MLEVWGRIMNSYFKFKKFTVYQEKCAMKVGTDAVLLGAWVNTGGVRQILDVGTGTGLIALMCAQRSEALIDAVEIDQAAAEQAFENVSNCLWSSRIKVIKDSFQHFAQSDSALKYDLIVSNPPYFSNSLKSPQKTRSLARHNDELSMESLLFYSARLLNSGGVLGIIVPFDGYRNIVASAHFNGFYVMRQLLIRPKEGKNFTRVMLELSMKSKQEIINELTLRKAGSNDYTEEFKLLTRDFYLKF